MTPPERLEFLRPPAAVVTAEAADVFPGDSEMAARCRAADWSATELGPEARWSPTLRAAVRLVLDSPVAMSLWCGPNYTLLYNDAYRRILGAKHPTAFGQPGSDVFAELWAEIGPQFADVRAGGPALAQEDVPFTIARLDGGGVEEGWFNYALSAVRGEATPDGPGAVVAVLSVVLEATPRVRAERARAVEQARLEEVFRRAPSFIVAYRGPEQTYEFVNEAYYQLVGHREIIGKPLLEALPEVRGQGFKELLDRVRETGEPWVGRETRVELQRTPGAPLETRYLDMVFQALTEADGTRSAVVAHGADVTAQVLARLHVEQLLAESDAANAQLQEQGLELALATGTPYETEFRLRAGATGEYRWHLARALPERDATGAVVSWVGSNTDVEGERRARADAEAANRAKGEFLAVMSHELRTPLNAIGGYAELLELGIRGPVSDPQRQDLARIQQSQRHLLGLINEVLNYARLETGTVQYDVADVPIREALAAAEALVAPQAQTKGLRLVVADAPPELAVRADAEKLRQVIVNLLSNAVKFTHAHDGRPGRIDLSCAEDGARVVVRVRDTGIGIPADKLDAIFDPFVQVRADLTRPHEGTGLGLAISRDLARGMGGDLAAESTEGEGSTFILTLPRAP